MKSRWNEPLAKHHGAKHHGSWIIVSSFLIAFLLTELPLPTWVGVWRPAWVAMVLIYWCLALPDRVGVGAGWLSGLTLDALGGGLIGQYAFILCITAFIAGKYHQQIRVNPIWRQCIIVFAMIGLHQLLALWINLIRGMPVPDWAYISSPLVSSLLWPWVFIILRDMRRKYRVG